MTTDAGDNQKDTVLQGAGGDSDDKGQQDSTTPKTYTEEEVEKKFSEQRSVLDKKVAVLEKAAERSKKAIEAADARAKDAEDAMTRAAEEREKSELVSIGDNADALSIFHGKRSIREGQETLRQEKADLARDRAQHEEDIKELKELKAFRSATEIASKPEYKDVEASQLVELSDGTTESMEKLAKALSGVKPKETKGGKDSKTKAPDSGESDGGGAHPTNEQLEEMSMDKYAEHVKKRDEGKI